MRRAANYVPAGEVVRGKQPRAGAGVGVQAGSVAGSELWPALWTFTEVDGIEPTNNAAERGLRGAVIFRKLSLGSQSEAGERMIERLLSVSQTCRPQRRSLFAYLAEVFTARTRGDPVPLLV
jgi:hypothetical protein